MSHVEGVRVGEIEIAVVCEGFAPLDLAEECPGHDVDWAAERARHPWAFTGDAAWPWHVHGFVVRVRSSTIVVDTGRRIVPTVRAVGRAGVRRSVGRGRPRCGRPRRRHAPARRPRRRHGGPGRRGEVPERPVPRYTPPTGRTSRSADDTRPTWPVARWAGLAEEGRVSLEAEDHEIVPGVRVLHTPGHTPGPPERARRRRRRAADHRRPAPPADPGREPVVVLEPRRGSRAGRDVADGAAGRAAAGRPT